METPVETKAKIKPARLTQLLLQGSMIRHPSSTNYLAMLWMENTG